MGSQVGGMRSGDPEFLAGAPGVVRRYLPLAVWAFIRGRPRSLAADAARVTVLLDPQPRIEDTHLIPREEPFVLVANHYQAPRLWIGWVAAALTTAVAQARAARGDELHWLVIAEWGEPKLGGRWVANPLTTLIFPRACRIWGMVPTPQRPEDVSGRARALRQVLAYLGRRGKRAHLPPEPVAIMPEGRGTVALEEAMPGTGAFLQRLSGFGVPLLPVGIYNEGPEVVVRFGPLFALGAPPAGTADVDGWARERVMARIGQLLPEQLWGVYAEAVARETMASPD